MKGMYRMLSFDQLAILGQLTFNHLSVSANLHESRAYAQMPVIQTNHKTHSFERIIYGCKKDVYTQRFIRTYVPTFKQDIHTHSHTRSHTGSFAHKHTEPQTCTHHVHTRTPAHMQTQEPRTLIKQRHNHASLHTRKLKTPTEYMLAHVPRNVWSEVSDTRNPNMKLVFI